MAVAENRRRIAVLEPDIELFRAISLSLSAWDVETIPSQARAPHSSQPEAVQVASRLARQLDVEAVVWVSSADGGSLLWVFDARAGDVTTRLLAEKPPFDSAAAASVALSIKTVLRASVVAPPAERFGAEPVRPKELHVVALELGLGGNWIAERETALRFEVSGVAWLGAARRLGIGLELSTGPAVTIDDARFVGRYSEHVTGAKVRLRLLREPSVSADVALGGAAHFTSLQGTLVRSSLEREVTRVNGSLDLEASINGYLGSATYLGISAGVGYLPAYRRYLVEGNPVFSPWPVVFGVSGYCGVELF